MRALVFGLALALLPAAAAGQHATPYAGQEGRAIKALDPKEVDDLLAGRGMGLAKAAELNHYPGPLHVLEHARALGLTSEQEQATRALFERMQTEARRLGREVVERERRLDQAFADGTIDRGRLEALVSEIARLSGELRVVHLATHLEMKRILTADQIAGYDRLRGYAGGAAGHGAHGHGGHTR